jgi:hypothetical protein
MAVAATADHAAQRVAVVGAHQPPRIIGTTEAAMTMVIEGGEKLAPIALGTCTNRLLLLRRPEPSGRTKPPRAISTAKTRRVSHPHGSCRITRP